MAASADSPTEPPPAPTAAAAVAVAEPVDRARAAVAGGTHRFVGPAATHETPLKRRGVSTFGLVAAAVRRPLQALLCAFLLSAFVSVLLLSPLGPLFDERSSASWALSPVFSERLSPPYLERRVLERLRQPVPVRADDASTVSLSSAVLSLRESDVALASQWIVMAPPRTLRQLARVAQCCREATGWRVLVALEARFERGETGRTLRANGCLTVLARSQRAVLDASRLWQHWRTFLLSDGEAVRAAGATAGEDGGDDDMQHLRRRITDTTAGAAQIVRNLGYYIAIARGARVILDAAAGECGMAQQYPHYTRGKKRPAVRAIHPLQAAATCSVVNPLAYFDRPDAVPRGFPLGQYVPDQLLVRSADAITTPVLVWQGLSSLTRDLHPSVLALNPGLRASFGPHFYRRRAPIAITPGFFAPVSARQTLVAADAFAHLFLPSSGDMVRGYFLQRLLWALPGAVAFELVEDVARLAELSPAFDALGRSPSASRDVDLDTDIDDRAAAAELRWLDEHLLHYINALSMWAMDTAAEGFTGADMDQAALDLAVHVMQWREEEALWTLEDVLDLRLWQADVATARAVAQLASAPTKERRANATSKGLASEALQRHRRMWLGNFTHGRQLGISTAVYRGFAPPGALWVDGDPCVAPRPTIDILLKTRDEDEELLLIYFLSQRLLLPRHLYRQLVVPVADTLEDLLRLPLALLPSDVRIVREQLTRFTLGKIGRQWTILWADQYTDADYILVPDTDQVYATHVNYHRLFRDGRPITRWSRSMSVHTFMYEHTQVYMLGSVKHDHMFELPVLMPREVFPAFRAYVEKRHGGKVFNEIFAEMLKAVPRRHDEELVCQFCLLLQYASDHMKDAFHWVEVGQNATTKPFPWVARHIGYEHRTHSAGERLKTSHHKAALALGAVTSGVCHHRYQHVPLDAPTRRADRECRVALNQTVHDQPRALYIWEHHVSRLPEPFDQSWLGKFYDDDDDFDVSETWRCAVAT